MNRLDFICFLPFISVAAAASVVVVQSSVCAFVSDVVLCRADGNRNMTCSRNVCSQFLCVHNNLYCFSC